MDNKTKRFNNWIFKELNDSNHFDKLKYVFNRIRNTMIEENPEFKDLAVDKQITQVVTIYKMIMNGKRGTMNDLSIFRRKEKDDDIKKYDVEYGFVEPDYIQIMDGNGKLLMIESI